MNYLLADTAVNGEYMIHMLKQQFTACRSLFEGTADEGLDAVAPYLFHMPPDAQNSGQLPEEIRAQLFSYVIIDSLLTLEDLARHLGKFIYKVENGRTYYFRFWDPAVLKVMNERNDPLMMEIFGSKETTGCMAVHNNIEIRVKADKLLEKSSGL